MARGIACPGDRCPGGFQVREKVPDALLVFVQAPSLEALEAGCGPEGPTTSRPSQRRLPTARRELELAARYDVQVINDDLDRAVDELAAILTRHGCGARSDHD